jgi:hypothetical protein
VEIEVLAPVENSEAKRVQSQIVGLVKEICQHESSLAHDFAKLGTLLLTVREQKYWLDLNYKSFGSYLSEIQTQLGKGRAQLYQAISVCEKLLPEVTEEELARMGISKAIALRKAVDPITGHLAPDLLKMALDPKATIEDLRGAIYKETNQVPDEDGKWRDLGGIFLTPDENAEFERAMSVATRTDPVIPKDIPDHIRRKEIFMRWGQEYLATYEAQVERGEG